MSKCKKHYDLRGKCFGYLIPLHRVSKDNEITIWKCRCEFCGNTTNVTYSNLLSGNTKRCQKCKGRKFDIVQSKRILKERISGMTLAKLAEKYNVSCCAITNAIKLVFNQLNKKENMYSYKITYKEKVLDCKLTLLEANNRLLYYLNSGLNNTELRIISE